ncbi:CCA tRNA nucleotidyltransferase [Thermoactinomyces sp. DSM 45892]|uniref:CCA tRNA nucleotidyltransferase n=1 Tax=Thermoactinomyces sp. DSM 45892 TaxID=1882753 RepID=UPI0008987CB4|nr:CCA tRNA nucleotidyltransferase [Thermoactinomyces sp. DSM 45892]SDY98261.1 tRNA nucleotidyltransferase (CCA-adding enzyme) [Thermoactinomyces sp. DSM 45892]
MDPRRKAAHAVIQKLNESGYEAYLVGGCVRDLLQGRIPNDYDIATSATPSEVQALFARSFATGLEHGTITVLWDQESVEVTTFRTEGVYKDHRRPSGVQFVRSLRDDLQRRDFTMNAMAMDLDGNLYDYFDGRIDLEKGMIRAVGTATERFGEDALRMIRAARFAAQFSFSIDPLIQEAMVYCKQDVKHLSVERIMTEMEKILGSPSPHIGFQVLLQTELFYHMPPLHHWQWDRQRVEERLNRIPSHCQRAGKWVWFLLAFGTTADSVKSRTRECKCSKKDSQYFQSIMEILTEWERVKAPDEKWMKQVFLRYGLEPVVESYYIQQALYHETGCKMEQLRDWWAEMPVKRVTDLSIQGNELISYIEKKPGPWVKWVLSELCRLVVVGEIPNQKEILLKVGGQIATKYS